MQEDKGLPYASFRAGLCGCLGINGKQKKIREGLRWVYTQLTEALARKNKIDCSSLVKKLSQVERKIMKAEE